jgi:hypothetical protein
MPFHTRRNPSPWTPSRKTNPQTLHAAYLRTAAAFWRLMTQDDRDQWIAAWRPQQSRRATAAPDPVVNNGWVSFAQRWEAAYMHGRPFIAPSDPRPEPWLQWAFDPYASAATQTITVGCEIFATLSEGVGGELYALLPDERWQTRRNSGLMTPLQEANAIRHSLELGYWDDFGIEQTGFQVDVPAPFPLTEGQQLYVMNRVSRRFACLGQQGTAIIVGP